jgi:hypothetical protein
MSNVPEEAGKVATSAIEAMKGQPVLIALLLLNALFGGLIYFGVQATRATQAIEWKTVIERCLPGNDKQ